MYRRLMSVVDDFGRFHGSPLTVRAACWPTCPEKVNHSEVVDWLRECCEGPNPLIVVYQVAGAKYLQLSDFRQQTRTKSKFPEPESGLISSCEQNVGTSRSRISYSGTDPQPQSGPISDCEQHAKTNGGPLLLSELKPQTEYPETLRVIHEHDS